MMLEHGSAPAATVKPGPLQELKRQWRGSPVLRLGVAAIALIGATEGLHRVAMEADRLSERAATLAQENALLERQLSKEPWTDRLDEARRHLQAAQSMVWTGSDESLVQASLQDRLRSLASAAGLDVREVVVARQVLERLPTGTSGALASTPGASAEAQQAALASRLDQDGVQVWRLRLSAGFTKVALVNFLTELSAQDKLLVTEQLRVRTGGSSSTVEIELRALSRLSAPGRAPSGQP